MKRNKFSLSKFNLLTTNMGQLIPIGWHEAMPGDTIQHSTSALIRVSPLLSPVMHPVRVRIHHWFVPNRLMWANFEDFITGGPDGMSLPVHPHFQEGEITQGSLQDYMQVPTGTYTAPIQYSALPARAFNLIYNEHYRDQDLIDPIEVSLEDGLDETTPQDILRVAWEKDYFTTARPWETKGPDITIPIGDSAPVVGTGGIPTYMVDGESRGQQMTLGTKSVEWAGNDPTKDDFAPWDDPSLQADLSQATGISVNDLRLSLALQRYQEARAQYGSRYVEYLRQIGIRNPSDARLQNPEYLGGGRQVIQFSEILQTAADDHGAEQTPVGTLRGHGIAAMRTNKYRRFFEEHGIVMTLLSVIPKTIYMQSLNRAFSRETKEDYFQKELQFVGEQIIPNKEIYANHSEPNETFGYQSRYDEYRYQPSTVSGEFRSILNYWHYARDFASDIALNQSFIEADPTKRVNAAQENDVLYIQANHSIQARRPMSKFAKSRTF